MFILPRAFEMGWHFQNRKVQRPGMLKNLPEHTHLVRPELGFELVMSFTYSDSTRVAKTKTDLVLEILFFFLFLEILFFK